MTHVAEDVDDRVGGRVGGLHGDGVADQGAVAHQQVAGAQPGWSKDRACTHEAPGDHQVAVDGHVGSGVDVAKVVHVALLPHVDRLGPQPVPLGIHHEPAVGGPRPAAGRVDAVEAVHSVGPLVVRQRVEGVAQVDVARDEVLLAVGKGQALRARLPLEGLALDHVPVDVNGVRQVRQVYGRDLDAVLVQQEHADVGDGVRARERKGGSPRGSHVPGRLELLVLGQPEPLLHVGPDGGGKRHRRGAVGDPLGRRQRERQVLAH